MLQLRVSHTLDEHRQIVNIVSQCVAIVSQETVTLEMAKSSGIPGSKPAATSAAATCWQRCFSWPQLTVAS